MNAVVVSEYVALCEQLPRQEDLGMNAVVVSEYVALCEQLTASDSSLDPAAEERLYARLDQLWYLEMSGEDREVAEGRLSAAARADHDDRRREEIDV